MHIIDYSFLFLVILLIVILGLVTRFKNPLSYLVAERSTGLFSLTATLVMTELNTATLISFASIGYIAGLWALVMPCIFLIGLNFYAFTVAKKWKEYDGFSVSGFFRERFGKQFGTLVSITLMTAMLGFSATYVKSMALLFTPILPSLPDWALAGLFTLLALLITIRGGLISIIYTDVLSFLLTLVFFPLLLYFCWNRSIEPSFTEGMNTLPPRFVFSLVVITMFTYILAPWYGQKLFAAKNQTVAYTSVLLAAFIIFCLYALVVLPAALIKSEGIILDHPEQVLPYILSHKLPYGFKGLGYAIFFAASATTLTGLWNAMAAMVIDELGYTKDQKPRTLTCAIAFTSFVVSITFIDSIFSKMILANIPIFALSFALLGGFYWEKTSKAGAYLSVIVGLIWGTISYLYWGEEGGYTWYWAVFGLPFIFTTGIAGSILLPNKQQTSDLYVA